MVHIKIEYKVEWPISVCKGAFLWPFLGSLDSFCPPAPPHGAPSSLSFLCRRSSSVAETVLPRRPTSQPALRRAHSLKGGICGCGRLALSQSRSGCLPSHPWFLTCRRGCLWGEHELPALAPVAPGPPRTLPAPLCAVVFSGAGCHLQLSL